MLYPAGCAWELRTLIVGGENGDDIYNFSQRKNGKSIRYVSSKVTRSLRSTTVLYVAIQSNLFNHAQPANKIAKVQNVIPGRPLGGPTMPILILKVSLVANFSVLEPPLPSVLPPDT